MQRSLLAQALGLAALLALPASAQIADYTPLDEQTLRNPSPGDWLQWRNTDNGWGYSALDQITPDNVGALRMVWGWAMEPGQQETGPLIYNGTMFLANPGGLIQALNAETGDLLWEYKREFGDTVRPGAITRGLAVFGDHIYYAAPDAVMVALDARTGQIAWETVVADTQVGHYFTAAPIVAEGMVVAGYQGCNRFREDKCAIVGIDAASGEEMWRVDTIEPESEGDSWGGTPHLLRGGGDIWTSGTYDAENGLVLIGVSQAKPWARASRGHDGATLYTNAVLAIEPATGEVAWYRQYIPGDSNDMDEAFEHMLIEIEGSDRYVNMGKLGILWQGDPADGAATAAYDLGWQNQIDLQGAAFADYRDGMVPDVNVPIAMCPSTAGFRSWRAMAFSPETRAVYVPISMNCDAAMIYREVEMVEGGGGNGQAGSTRTMHPDSPENMGRFVAMNVDTGDVLWQHDMRAPANTSTLTTAGGVMFAGDWDRNLYAFDQATGEVLWQTRLPQAAQGYLAAYAVNGRQYIAVPIGVGGASWSTSLPITLLPEIRRPSTGNGLLVFALPDVN
ncbi:pyrroloquinoline quinone-dependent dehydrogenase [Ketogulonicigenium vulgare]|uniref:Pyrrolo-quinoline quinone n=1 Tax=Ketogulonicigenium vulgare (strain WSH-001) TaxID=759362 RepID=F9YBW9_KETVW|nr:PQQ-binding-like beta-propeller repeat protein [Ketogulonicigenium vulgare]AEM42871.1 Pyrrolo-quinoline quinone [Ketogulonicigenium vulgare WSH-001]ALJ82703.1 pyrrolo-quinoline quinone [Ketogulonicigenium vulgare]